MVGDPAGFGQDLVAVGAAGRIEVDVLETTLLRSLAAFSERCRRQSSPSWSSRSTSRLSRSSKLGIW